MRTLLPFPPPASRGQIHFVRSDRLPEYLGFLTFPFKDRAGRDCFFALKEALKEFPGVTYQGKEFPHKYLWSAPVDAHAFLRRTAEEFDCYYNCKPWWEQKFETSEVALNVKGLHPYQAKKVAWIYGMRQALVADEMGLGKTAQAIRAFENFNRILVLCPAVVREVWRDQIQKWAAEENAQKIQVRTKGYDLWDPEGWVITSYGLLKNISGTFDAIVFDESHYIKNDTTNRTKAAKKILADSPKARVLLLTGTPVADNPGDLWSQLDFMYPKRYGTQRQFKKRYQNPVANPYAYGGWDFVGLNEETAPELKTRFDLVAARTVKSEVSHLLPPLSVSVARIAPEGILGRENWVDEDAYREWCQKYNSTKVREAIAFAENVRKVSGENVLIFTYLRDTAHKIAEGIEGLCVTGEIAPGKRNALIKEAIKKNTHIVATIDSVGVGVDALAGIATGAFAESSYYPTAMLQAMARLHRLSSSGPVNITVFVFEGTIDEKIALTLETKLFDANQIIKAGASEAQLVKGLGITEEGWAQHMADVAEGRVEELLW